MTVEKQPITDFSDSSLVPFPPISANQSAEKCESVFGLTALTRQVYIRFKYADGFLSILDLTDKIIMNVVNKQLNLLTALI